MVLRIQEGRIISRGSIRVEEDVSVLEILSVRAELEVFFEGIAAFDRGKGGFVDLRGAYLFGHDCCIFGVVSISLKKQC